MIHFYRIMTSPTASMFTQIQSEAPSGELPNSGGKRTQVLGAHGHQAATPSRDHSRLGGDG